MSQDLQNALQTFIRETVEKQIKENLNKIDLKESVSKFVKQSIEDKISNLEFPHGSINNSSISWGGFRLNANMITGEFDNLVSQQISTPELSVNNEGVQVTHCLHSPDIVSENLNSTNLNAQEITVNNIKVSGQLTADNILGLNEKIQQFLGGDSLPRTVVNSNLKSVGQLNDLVVSGESLLGDSLYASSTGRIGINTDEPTSTLTLWDEETNLNIGKNKQHTIEIRSKSDVVIGSSTHDNILLTQNGDAKINSLIINNTRFSTVSETPGFEGEKGDLAWNSNPAVGQPVGWVCLGGAVWSKFGIAE
jgi:hypothetical protein